MKRGLALLPLLAGCSRLDELLLEPPLTPAQWCASRPCHAIAGLVLGDLLGSFLVFLLAVLWIGAGWVFLSDSRRQQARRWFGVALILGGIGAALAGISYQAFGYELKCAGRELCVLTNGFEVGYSLSQALSVSAMLIAVAYACVSGSARTAVVALAAVNAVAYVAVTVAGVLLPSRVLLSFEVLMLFALPGTLLVIGVSGSRYLRERSAIDRSLLSAALLLMAVEVAYFAYAAAGLTQRFWNGGEGFYFSENEVLHLGMIGWLAYVSGALKRELVDRSETADTPR